MRPVFTRITVVMLTAVGTIFLSEPLSMAQAGSRSYPVGRRVEELNRQADQYEREVASHGEKKDESPDRKRTRAAAVQVREDFGRIQTIHNEIVLAISAGKTLDRNFIASALEGINKSASRLRHNLALPRIDDKEKHPKKENRVTEMKLATSLTLLCAHISNFVTNPLFESSGVLDVDLTFKASRDLHEIIELSDNLKRNAGKLQQD